MADFTTTDLGFASFLYAKGVKYKGTRERPGDWKQEFVFEQSTELPALTVGWQSGTMEVGALAFWNASRRLAREVKRRDREN